jgi:acyl-CoA synthetase (AMP-forming)/AMP-acid ligase II/acyl carrier protein
MKLFDSLTAVLQETRGLDRSIRFIDGDRDETIVAFSELHDRASCLLAALQERGMRPGDELVIFTRSNESLVVAFWAAILGGIVPVPVAVGISDEHRLKLLRILGQLASATLYTEPELHERLGAFAETIGRHDILPLLAERTVRACDIPPGRAGRIHEPSPDDVAFIQYSSGSTSDPKGVCLTHRNLAANIRAIVEGTGWTGDDISLSWMPLTHDMGLIGYHLSVLAAGMNHAVMDTSLFVRRPLLWMTRAGELAATQLCSPNFGYKHFLKVFERKGLDGTDLSPVKLVLNGAEPISWDLCEAFLGALAPYGLKRSVMFPVYGLAEATVAVSFPALGSEYSRIVVDRHSLSVGAPYTPAEPGAADAVSFVKVGGAVRDCRIRIADDADQPLPEGRVGHIQVQGANVTRGLYGDEAGTAGLFTADGWLKTGDCGVFVDGELVITGRAKDIIIVNGQNYYPHDIEEIIADIEELDLGKVVACGVGQGRSETEELLVFLLWRQELEAFRELADRVRARVGEHAGLEIDHVIPVNRIPKTTSGKVQRAQLAASYLDGEFDDVLAQLVPPPPAAEAAAGENGIVRDLLKICNEFSKERRIGPDDNLFEVGISSLTLTEIVLALDEKYPGKVDINDLFDYPTVRELARFLAR